MRHLGDYDRDGFTDFYITNIDDAVLLRNNGDGTFSDRARAAGVGRGRIGIPEGNSVGWGTAFLDYDGDGCLDLYLVNIGELEGRPGVAKLFRNNCANGNNWLIVRTVGTRSNRDGSGATITVSAAGVRNAEPSPPAAARCRKTCWRPTSDWVPRRTSVP